MASNSTTAPAKKASAPFRVQTLKKILDLAETYQLEELSFAGIYLKRGGPIKADKSKGKPVSQSAPIDTGWSIEDIDAQNAPILRAYAEELKVAE